MSDVGERMKGGAVREERSPEKEAILGGGEGERRRARAKSVRFQKRGPRAALGGRNGLEDG